MASYRDQLTQAIDHFCARLFGQFVTRKGQGWTPQRLLWVGLMMVWSEGQTMVVRFEQPCDVAGDHAQHERWQRLPHGSV